MELKKNIEERFSEITEKNVKENSDFYKILVAIDEFRHIALVDDLKGNLNNVDFKELVYDQELMEDDIFDKLDRGFYELVFFYYGWEENTENGRDGDSDLVTISIQKKEISLR